MNAKTFAILLVVAAPIFAQDTHPPAAKKPAGSAAQKTAQKTFDTPEAAVQALIDAAAKNDAATLAAILGSSAEGILTTGDSKEDQAERQEFARLASQKHVLEKSSMNRYVQILVIGDQQWPFPIPVVENAQRWRFDAIMGAIEMRAREIGEDELDAIEACAGYVDAQEAYASKKRSPAGTQEYAQQMLELAVPPHFIAAATENSTKPYHGYYFRVLTSGTHPWIVGKAMIGGFGLVAWPAEYGVTGVHTFIVNQDGVVYEKDRGAQPKTPVTRFDPNDSWEPVDQD